MRPFMCLLAVSLAALSGCSTNSAPPPAATEATPGAAAHDVHATFACAAGKSIVAVFVNAPPARVALTLSDGRQLQLPQALSASGARYASSDGSLVFWNKGRGAFIEEGGQHTFDDCQQQPAG
jgi:membrane-bound inhibitor of C-type lysozyme